MTDQDAIAAELLAFFRSICANPAAIHNINDDVRELCGYGQNLAGWRGLANQINTRPSIWRLRLRLDPTDMDGVKTIAGIMSKLYRYASFGSTRVAVSPADLRFLTAKADTANPRRAVKAAAAYGHLRGRQRVISARLLTALTNKKGV